VSFVPLELQFGFYNHGVVLPNYLIMFLITFYLIILARYSIYDLDINPYYKINQHLLLDLALWILRVRSAGR